MQLDDAAKLVEAVAKLIGAVAWPTAVTFAVLLLRPAIERFLSTLSEVRLKGSGFEASAIRRLDGSTPPARNFTIFGSQVGKSTEQTRHELRPV